MALDGYNGMLKGKIDVISGLTTGQKIMMSMIPFTPKKLILKTNASNARGKVKDEKNIKTN